MWTALEGKTRTGPFKWASWSPPSLVCWGLTHFAHRLWSRFGSDPVLTYFVPVQTWRSLELPAPRSCGSAKPAWPPPWRPPHRLLTCSGWNPSTPRFLSCFVQQLDAGPVRGSHSGRATRPAEAWPGRRALSAACSASHPWTREATASSRASVLNQSFRRPEALKGPGRALSLFSLTMALGLLMNTRRGPRRPGSCPPQEPQVAACSALFHAVSLTLCPQQLCFQPHDLLAWFSCVVFLRDVLALSPVSWSSSRAVSFLATCRGTWTSGNHLFFSD